MANLKIVVVGGVAAGPKAAARARRLLPNAEITVIERGELLSYAGCGMPYYIQGKVKEINELMNTPAGVTRDVVFFQKVKNINVLNRTLATRIDRQAKTVEVACIDTGERQVIPYDKLVLATGGLPVAPPIEGNNLKRVFQLNHPDDAQAIRDAAQSGQVRRAVIIGGGLIGLEVTEALAAQGIEVSIAEMLDYLLPNTLDVEMAAFLTKHVQAKGNQVYTSEKVLRIEADSQGNVRQVITDQREIEADMVLMAVGVRPNVQLAREAGLDIGSTGAIAVNQYLQTSDPHIYAGGDCVETPDRVSGRSAFWPMGSIANRHGRVIGDNLAGRGTVFAGAVGTVVLKVFDYNVARTGLTEKQARSLGYEVVTSLSPSPDCAHYYPDARLVLVKLIADAKTGKLLGGQAIGPGEAVKRMDVLATALHFGATVNHIGELDLGYSPPYSTAIDVLAHAANIIQNKLNGLANGVSPVEAKSRADQGESFVWLDVRTQKEYDQQRIDDPRVKLIPLGRLRERATELPRDQDIIIFCKSSLRAYEAQRILQEFGFERVSFMEGGLVAWPYAVRSGA